MSRVLFTTLFCMASITMTQPISAQETTGPLDRSMASLQGKDVNLQEYQGDVVLVVNVASKCGLTPQYTALQELYTKYHPQGLQVLGFPCNQFGKQEPGTAKEIQEFCEKNYGVTFDMLSRGTCLFKAFLSRVLLFCCSMLAKG